MEQIIFTLSIVSSAVFLLRYCDKGPSLRKSVVKTLSVAGLVGVAVIAGAPWLLVVGLALGVVGDLALSRDGKRAFSVGLVAFALGHIAYIGLLWQFGAMPKVSAMSGLVICAAVAMLAVLVPRAGQLGGAVAGYICIITVMGVLALGLPADLWIGGVAALLFAASDALLGVSLFALAPAGRSNWPLSAAIWTSYFASQVLFLAGFGGDWLL